MDLGVAEKLINTITHLQIFFELVIAYNNNKDH